MSYQLRDYQQQAVNATIKHFKRCNDSAVIVLPTGSGKSLVISELARLARHKILVLAHVKELVAQNHQKYASYGLTAGIYSAGLNKKQNQHQVTFANIQSVSPNLASFDQYYSLIIIDECHRVGLTKDDSDIQNQYQQIIAHLTKQNSNLKVLGLTATPYRLGSGWIYQDHYHGFTRSDKPCVFQRCIFEMPLSLMIQKGYLTTPQLIDAATAHYDFSNLQANKQGNYSPIEMNELLSKHPRVTQTIVEQIIDLSSDKRGVMIFAATTQHAKEILGYLATQSSSLILGDTPNHERDQIIQDFCQQKIKFLVNVAVLTTGFDAPHVDFIALLRPTQSVSLFQQIVGRGLRLYPDKQQCVIIDYTNSGFDLYKPEVGSPKPDSCSQEVLVNCPSCQFGNTFWGKVDDNGCLIEHYGRRCWGFEEDEFGVQHHCDYRFRFKECSQCGLENDIAAKHCIHCHHTIIDPDALLKKALSLKDSLVIRCSGMTIDHNQKADNSIKINYFDEDGAKVSEFYYFDNKHSVAQFNQQFGKRVEQGTNPTTYRCASTVIDAQCKLSAPDFVIAKKSKHFWQITHKLFDYAGHYRKANQL